MVGNLFFSRCTHSRTAVTSNKVCCSWFIRWRASGSEKGFIPWCQRTRRWIYEPADSEDLVFMWDLFPQTWSNTQQQWRATVSLINTLCTQTHPVCSSSVYVHFKACTGTKSSRSITRVTSCSWLMLESCSMSKQPQSGKTKIKIILKNNQKKQAGSRLRTRLDTKEIQRTRIEI